MCEKLTSHLFNVKAREMLVHTICSHSDTRAALGLNGKDPNIIEVEWIEGKTAPSIRWSTQDQDEQQLVIDWYDKRFPSRKKLMFHCISKAIGGSLYLSGLTSIPKELVLPTTIGGSLYLSGLTSIPKDLVLPTTIGGSLYLIGLTSAKGLVLPTTIGGFLYLSGLTSADKDLLREQYPNLASKI